MEKAVFFCRTVLPAGLRSIIEDVQLRYHRSLRRPERFPGIVIAQGTFDPNLENSICRQVARADIRPCSITVNDYAVRGEALVLGIEDNPALLALGRDIMEQWELYSPGEDISASEEHAISIGHIVPGTVGVFRDCRYEGGREWKLEEFWLYRQRGDQVQPRQPYRFR
ncbi:hypothetical protein KY362_05670 [Candidatus Woesearchaeota archaeon]|nr:hypothetical protein [Candidatus Woesearchaeota archaeon]